MSIGVCTRRLGPITFIAPLPTSPLQLSLSGSVTNNRCAPSCGGHKRKVRGHIKKFSAGASRRHSAPHLQIASDATGGSYDEVDWCCCSLDEATVKEDRTEWSERIHRRRYRPQRPKCVMSFEEGRKEGRKE